MKNKGILFVMAGIIAVGVLVTTCTSFYVEKQAGSAQSIVAEVAEIHASTDMETLAGAMPADVEEAMPGARAAMGDIAAATEVTDESSKESDSDLAVETSPETDMISPLDNPVPEAGQMQGTTTEEGVAANKSLMIVEQTAKTDYRARMTELDSQVLKIREEGTESTNYSLKTAAENELKLWDSELNAVYNDILNQVNEEEAANLVTEERDWMKKRDALAVEAAKKSAGGTLEGLEYTASLAASTRDRAYQLADVYEQVVQ